MTSLSLDHPFSGDYQQEPTARKAGGSASPNTVTHDHSVASEQSAVNQAGAVFIKAPQKFFGKFFEVNVAERTPEEKEANQAVRTEFRGTLHEFFGPVLAEYLYPHEEHEKLFQEGAPLTPQQAQKLVNKGMEMVDALAEYCKQYLDDKTRVSSSQRDQLDYAMISYAQDQEAASKENGMMDLLPHAAKVVGGGAMAAFAVATMGHLTPTDIFFLVDLLSSKKLSKGIENFITTRLLQHIESHLESYLQEERAGREAKLRQELPTAKEAVIKGMLDQEDHNLEKLLTGNTQSLSHDAAYPSAKSGAIHTADLMIGGGAGIVHTPLDAVKFIFQGEAFTTGAHNHLFRDGVTAVIENVKKIQESVSKTKISTEELSKIKKAIATAQQIEGNGTWTDVEDQKSLKASAAPAAKKQGRVFRAQLTRGI